MSNLSTDHNDENARQQMLGHHRSFWEQLSVKDWVAAISLFMAAVAIYVGVSVQIALIEERLNVVPEQVRKDVEALSTDVNDAIRELSAKIETTRIERNEEFKELNRRVNAADAERAAIRQQVENLNDLMRDIRELMRDRAVDRAESKG